MKRNRLYGLLLLGLVLFVAIILRIEKIYAWVVSIGDDSSTIEIGEVRLNLTAEPSETLKLNVTSPTFFLDPEVINLHTTDQRSLPRYTSHEQQFGKSVKRIQLTLVNTGNVPGKIAYGSTNAAEGIVLTLIDGSLVDNQNDLTGIVYLIVPHQSLLSESQYYQHILSRFTATNRSLTYVDFASLQTSLNTINQQTITDARAKVIQPLEELKFDIFVWQEYYDGGPYQSQYDPIHQEGEVIFKKQEFSLKLMVYFGQLGIQ